MEKALASLPILRLPRPDLPFTMDTDASDYQVGCALLQLHEDGVRHPVVFRSRYLSSAERNYSVGEKECLTVVWAVPILRPCLERRHFDLYTDHQALKWMMYITDVSGRLARSRLCLLEFEFSVRYKKGLKNTIADAVSRLPTYEETKVDPDL